MCVWEGGSEACSCEKREKNTHGERCNLLQAHDGDILAFDIVSVLCEVIVNFSTAKENLANFSGGYSRAQLIGVNTLELAPLTHLCQG